MFWNLQESTMIFFKRHSSWFRIAKISVIFDHVGQNHSCMWLAKECIECFHRHAMKIKIKNHSVDKVKKL